MRPPRRFVIPASAPALVVLLSAGVDAQEIPDFARDLPEIRSGEPTFRFNGRDLSGFYTYLRDDAYEDPMGVFSVEDGAIRVSGEQYGGLVTRESFRDYHLIVEWRWGDRTFAPRKERARDSGILLHCVGPDGSALGQWMQSQECQIIEGGCGDFIMVPGDSRPSLTVESREGPDGQLHFHPEGTPTTRDSGRFNWWGRDPEWRDELGFRGRNDVERPAGEWNRMEVVCDGDTIVNIVNGLVVNVGAGSSLTEGKILFQSEGAEIFFRRIEIRPLLRD